MPSKSKESALSSFQSLSQKAAADVVTKAVTTTVPALQAAYDTHFASSIPSQLATSFQESATSPSNAAVAQALGATTDAVQGVLLDILTLERFITLSVPQMEDGNNFGVTVQLAALKQISDGREGLTKALDELAKYSSTRADALEKCKLATKSTTVTTSTSEGSTESSKEDANSKETKQAKETKVTELVATEATELELRKSAVVAVDVLFYGKAQVALQQALTIYMAVVDFCDKNREKIEKPKGTRGGSSYSSMY